MTTYDEYGMPGGAYSEPESLAHQAWRVTRAFYLYRVQPRIREATSGQWEWKRILSLGRLLVVAWFVALYIGERIVFKSSVDSCRWESWEPWSSDANPHRLLFVADPQLVDPHTYPGRPWPLNTLTVKYTDQYIRRTYSRIQKVLYPDSVFLLGDLFDGGREWSTRTTHSPEERYQKYGNDFWLREYQRFGNIFFGHWGDGGLLPRPGQPGRKIISSLPGNHDLGFGKGIQVSVRKRFNAYFGDGNRIDIIGNHTFVSIDSVSLEAQVQENPQSVEELWKPTVEFLDRAKKQKQRLVQEELRIQQGLTRNLPFQHEIVDSERLAKSELPRFTDTVNEFPTILLSHVPLYRAEGTPCGPLREHWPPTPHLTDPTKPLEKDNRNAISVSGGYQYQNVLHKEITKDVTEKIGDIQYAFSGDDHDYCEVVHRGYASGGGGIREITVKSISWAMGVRKPGVVLVSMWNPVDKHGNSLVKEAGAPTLQTHLCLLPDQLGLFIRYALLFGITLFALTIRAALIGAGKVSSASQSNDAPLLPTIANASSAKIEKAALSHQSHDSSDTSVSNSSTSSDRGNLQVRSANTRTRSVYPNSYALSTAQNSYVGPPIQYAGYCDDRKTAKSWATVDTKRKERPKKKGYALFWQELRNSVFRVGAVVFVWYFWLMWNW